MMNDKSDKTISLKNNHMPAVKTFHSIQNPEKSANIDFNEEKTPFEIQWSFGWDSSVGLINISKRESQHEKLQVFFVSAHVGVILEYNKTKKSKVMKMLTGHRNSICSFDANSDGSFLVTAGGGGDSILIVWDTFHRTPIFMLSTPFKSGISIVKFSIDSKYVITVSYDTNNDQIINLWDWMSGSEKSTYSIKIDSSLDDVVHITCSYDNPNYYCLTTKKHVFFMTLVKDDNKLLITVPNRDQKQSKYNYTQSTYVTNFRQIVSASTGGLVTVWDDTNYDSIKIKNTPISNQKKLLKTVKLDVYSITTIICNKHIITGNTNGDIIFYDKSLCMMYHLNTFVGDSIASIAMIDVNKTHNVKDTVEFETSKNEIQNQIMCNNDSSERISSKVQCDQKPRIGIAFTAEQEFICDPFFISTRNCKIFQVDISKDSFTQILERYEDNPITALEVHPKQSSVILGDSIGRLNMYDYQTKMLIAKTVNNLEIKKDNRITCIKYSSNGFHLCYGCEDGSFWFVDPLNLTPAISKPFKWNESPVKHITFSKSSNYVLHTDHLFGIYMYKILPSKELSVKYYGCYEVHTGIIRGIWMDELSDNLTIYSIGVDHKIAIFDFDKTQDEHLKLVKVMKTEPWNKPRCMMKSTIHKKGLNLIISGCDLRLSVWDNNRCIRTTLGVNLKSPIKVMKECTVNKSVILFCTDQDIGMLRQPIDGNPYKNAAVLGSGKKLIDIGISRDGKYLFSISKDSTSMLMWSIHTIYLDRLEENGGTGLNAYGSLLKGGMDGSELKLLKEFFLSVQLTNSQNPEATVFSDLVDVCEVSFLMRAMGYYPSEKELSNMIYEMYTRREDKIHHASTLMTFEEFVILYLNYKPQIQLKFGEIRQAFDELVLNDKFVNANAYGVLQSGVLTRESFVHTMQNMGVKISARELEIILHTLCKTTNDLSSGYNDVIESIHATLPFTFTFKEIMTDLFGFPDTDD